MDQTRVANAKILREKIDKLGLSLIKIPNKFVYKNYVISELINGVNRFDSQKSITVPMLKELHKLIAEGPIKHYDMISDNWKVSGKYLYIIDTDSKCIPSTIDKQLFYETSWFLLGDIITGHGGCYMNRLINHPWQILIRSLWSKNSTYNPDARREIYDLFVLDVQQRLTFFNRYQKMACKILNCEWTNFSGKKFDPDNIAVQVAVALYLSDFSVDFREYLVKNPHKLKDIIYEVKARGYDECSGVSDIPQITNYEIEDLEKYLILEDKIGNNSYDSRTCILI